MSPEHEDQPGCTNSLPLAITGPVCDTPLRDPGPAVCAGGMRAGRKRSIGLVAALAGILGPYANEHLDFAISSPRPKLAEFPELSESGLPGRASNGKPYSWKPSGNTTHSVVKARNDRNKRNKQAKAARKRNRK